MGNLDAIAAAGLPQLDGFMGRMPAVTSARQLQAMANDPEKIREAAQGFEEVLLQKLLDEMQKTIPDGGLFDSSATQQVQNLFNMMLSKYVSKAGGIGLADDLYRQFSNMAELSPEATNENGLELEK